MSKGTYCLIMKLSKDRDITIGRRPTARFSAGFYCYVGSAMNSLEKRINRHKSSNKKLHWHIDWFLEHADIVNVKSIESKERLECSLSQDVALLSDRIPMPGFGSSDCKTCESHLYYFMEDPSERLEEVVKKWKDLQRHTESKENR